MNKIRRSTRMLVQIAIASWAFYYAMAFAANSAEDIRKMSIYAQAGLTIMEGYTSVVTDIVDIDTLIDEVEAGKITRGHAIRQQQDVLARAKDRYVNSRKQHRILKRPVISNPKLSRNLRDTEKMIAKLRDQAKSWLVEAETVVENYRKGKTIPVRQRNDRLARRTIALIKSEQAYIQQSLISLPEKHPNYSYLRAIYLTNDSLINVMSVLRDNGSAIEAADGLKKWIKKGKDIYDESKIVIAKGKKDGKAMVNSLKKANRKGANNANYNMTALINAIGTYKKSFDIESKMAKELYGAYLVAEDGSKENAIENYYNDMSEQISILVDKRLLVQRQRAKYLSQLNKK